MTLDQIWPVACFCISFTFFRVLKEKTKNITETIWSQKPRIFATWSFVENVC